MIFNYVYVHSERTRKIARNGQTKSGPNFSRQALHPVAVVQCWSLCSYDGCSKRLEQPQPYSLAGGSRVPIPRLVLLPACSVPCCLHRSFSLSHCFTHPGSCRWMRDNEFHNRLKCPVSCINLTSEKYPFLIFYIADCMTNRN